MHDAVMPQAQRETLALLKTTPLAMKEVGELRGVPWTSAARSLALLVKGGYATRHGFLPAARGHAAAFHWTGKAFQAPANADATSALTGKALSLPHQLRRFTLTQELTARSKA